MSRNVRGGPLVDFAMGGLNYQIEHHLFPSMPRPNLKRAQPLVRDYCDRHQVVAYSRGGAVRVLRGSSSATSTTSGSGPEDPSSARSRRTTASDAVAPGAA